MENFHLAAKARSTGKRVVKSGGRCTGATRVSLGKSRKELIVPVKEEYKGEVAPKA